MRLGGALVSIAAIALASGCYGPMRDDSRITSTALVGSNSAALVYHQYRYRPAAGIAAFPDGGIPHYEQDDFVVALAEGGRVRRLARFDNPALPGTGSISVLWSREDPAHLYLTRYAQATTSLPLRYFIQQVRINVTGGDAQPFDLRAELARHGRELGAEGFGEFVPVDTDGTLLLGASRGASREIWLRSSSAALHRLASFDRFERSAGDDVIYSVSGPPFTTFALNWRTGAVRAILRYNRQNSQQEWQARGDPAMRALNQPADAWASATSIATTDDGQAIRLEKAGRVLWSARIRR